MSQSFHSMTGFGRIDEQHHGVRLSIQLKSVNGRFLETRFRLPKEYSAFENDLKKVITEKFQRGTVDIFIHRAWSSDGSGEGGEGGQKVSVNVALAKSWLDAYGELKKAVKLDGEPTIAQLLHVPGVVELDHQSEVDDKEKKFLLKTFKTVVELCEKERAREGSELAKIVKKQCDDLLAIAKVFETHKEGMNEHLREKLMTRIKELSAHVEVDPQRISQELVLRIESADVSEEIDRLKVHLHNMEKLLKVTGPVGKKLDFYTQELHREVNTIGSKSHDLVISEKIIEAKTLIERLREQVQNVE